MEYLTGNSLITYPFKDGMTLKDQSSSNVVKNDCFLDVSIVCKNSNAVKAAMTALSKSGGNLVCQVTLYDSANSSLGNSNMTFAVGTVLDKVTLTFSDSLMTAKIVPGPGLVTLAAGSDFSYTFLLTTAEICPSAMVQKPPAVPQIEFFNTDQFTGLPVAVHTFNTAFKVAPRANVDIGFTSPNILLGVEPGAGTGLFDGCSVYTGVIKTINFVASNNGNFLLQGDGCYHMETQENGLVFLNTCTPTCTPDDIKHFAHYQNRLHNGLNTIVDYADTLYGVIDTDMVDYLTNQVPLKTRSTFDAIFVKTQDSHYTYYSFTVGMYNPSKADRTVTMTITPYGAELVPGTVKFKTNDTTVFYNNITSQVFTIPCLNYGTLVFVVRMGKNEVARLDIASTFYPNTKSYILIGGETEPLTVLTFGLSWISTTVNSGYTKFYPRLTGVMYNPTGSDFGGISTGLLTDATLSSGTMNVTETVPHTGGTVPIDFVLEVDATKTGSIVYNVNMNSFVKTIRMAPPSITVNLSNTKGDISGGNTNFYFSGNIVNPFDQTLSVDISSVLTGASLVGNFRIVLNGVASTYPSISATVTLPANSVSPIDFKVAVPTTTSATVELDFDYSTVLDPLKKTSSLQA